MINMMNPMLNIMESAIPKYAQPVTHDGERYRNKEKPMKGKILVIQRDFRSDCVSTPFLSMMALAAFGWEVTWRDPWRVVGPDMRESAMGDLKNPVPLEVIDDLRNNEYDLVVINDYPCEWDARNINAKVVFIYDEPWKGVWLPKGTDAVLTYDEGVKILWTQRDPIGQPMNTWKRFKSVRFNTDGLKPCIYPEVWPVGLNDAGEALCINEMEVNTRDPRTGRLYFAGYPEGAKVLRYANYAEGELVPIKRTVPLSYNGMLRNGKTDALMKVAKQRLTLWAAENLKCKYFFDPGMPVDTFLDWVPSCDAALHYSSSDLKHFDGTGQGAYENMVSGAVTFEYPHHPGSEKEGLIDYKTCLYFNDEKELQEKWNWFKHVATPQEILDIRVNGRKVALEHSFDKVMGNNLNDFFTIVKESRKLPHLKPLVSAPIRKRYPERYPLTPPKPVEVKAE